MIDIPLTEMEDLRATVTDVLQSTTFRLYWSAATSVTGAAAAAPSARHPLPRCVLSDFECLIGKQKKPILFKVTEPSSVPYRAPSTCAKRAAYPDPPPVIPLPESIAAHAAYQLHYKNTEYYSWVSSGPKCFQVLGLSPTLVCVECLIGKQKKQILFKVTKVTEPSSIPYRDSPAL